MATNKERLRYVLPVWLISALVASLDTGCGSSKSPYFLPVDDPAEYAAAVIGGASASGVLATLDHRYRSKFSDFLDLLIPFRTAQASGNCPAFSTGLCGSASTVTLSYNSCISVSGTNSTWNGSQLLAFGSSAQCSAGVPVCGLGNSLTRTFGANTTVQVPQYTYPDTSDKSGPIAYAETVSLDTTNPSGYLTPQLSGGFIVTGVTGGHTVAISGVHVVGTSSAPAQTVHDYTFSTNASLGGSPLNVTVPSCGSAARTITSGTLAIEYNTGTGAPWSGQYAINNVAWNGTSCFPQSGSISGTASSSGLATITFTGNGNASLATNTGTYNIVLRYCF